jgi:hypothetical protein
VSTGAQQGCFPSSNRRRDGRDCSWHQATLLPTRGGGGWFPGVYHHGEPGQAMTTLVLPAGGLSLQGTPVPCSLTEFLHGLKTSICVFMVFSYLFVPCLASPLPAPTSAAFFLLLEQGWLAPGQAQLLGCRDTKCLRPPFFLPTQP